jgi:hypothetical protein
MFFRVTLQLQSEIWSGRWCQRPVMSYIKMISRRKGIEVFSIKMVSGRRGKSYVLSKEFSENCYFFVTKWGASRLHLNSYRRVVSYDRQAISPQRIESVLLPVFAHGRRRWRLPSDIYNFVSFAGFSFERESKLCMHIKQRRRWRMRRWLMLVRWA